MQNCLMPNSPQVRSFQSQIIAQKVAHQIFEEAKAAAKVSQLIRINIEPYSYTRTQATMTTINNMQFDSAAFINQDYPIDYEPKPLLLDSMMTAGTKIDENVPKVSNLSSLTNRQRKGNQLTQEQQPEKEIYIKLPEIQNQEEEEDGFTKQLRKDYEDNKKKVDGEKKLLEREEYEKNQESKKKQEKKKKEKEEKFSYDFEGKIVKVQPESKNNLVNSILRDKIGASKNHNPYFTENSQPSVIDTSTKVQKKKGLASVLKRGDDVMFGEAVPLITEMKVNKGVRMSHNALVLEEKVRSPPIYEIKKSLSSRRLSVAEYKLLKDVTGSVSAFDQMPKQQTILNSQQNSKTLKTHGRTQSEAKLDTSRSKNIEIIHVNNEELLESLVQRNTKFQPFLVIQQEKDPSVSSKPMLDQIDNFNIDYIRTGGSLNHKKSTSTRKVSGKLPHITHTNMNSNHLPKQREKIKHGQELLRELRKTFEDKLRT